MRIDVLLYPTVAATREQMDRVMVVVDVLRATSTIVTALANGALEVIAVADPSEAIQLAKRLGEDQCLTGGERGGLPIPGLNLGNSPREYTRDVVEGKKLALCTTNGTQAIRWAQVGKKVFTASFLNASAVVEQLIKEDADVLLICSGGAGNLAMEDLLCAGRIAQELANHVKNSVLTDTAKLAAMAYKNTKTKGLVKALHETEHGQDLVELGLGDDVDYCAQIDLYHLVPVFDAGRVVLGE
jgi:2-phosphosulfolactate phosphatase